MIVYDGIKSEFLNSVMNGTIAEEVRQRIFEKMGRPDLKLRQKSLHIDGPSIG